MHKKYKIKLLLPMILIIVLGCTWTSFAATVFSDIDTVPWAKDFITKMADKEIIKGYFDSKTLKFTFKPNDKVTYVESVQMIYNMLKASNKLKTTNSLKAKYASVLDNHKIPDWAQEAVAYAVEYKIVQTGDLQSFVSGDKQVNAKKEDIAIFIGKALDMENDLDPLPILGFKDAFSIKSAAVPYVDLLFRKKIVSGNLENEFEPRSEVTRAVMAVMTSNTYDVMLQQTQPTTPTNPTTPTLPSNTDNVTKTRVMDYINSDGSMIVVKDEKGNPEIYRLDATVYVKKDNSYKKAIDLKAGDVVTLVFDKSDKLLGIEIDNTSTEFKGIIDYIVDYDDYYLMIAKDAYDAMVRKEYKIDEDTEIRMDGKEVSASKLKKGDNVTVKAVGLKATQVKVQTVEEEFDGILEKNNYIDIQIRIENDQIKKFEVDDKAYIKRDGSKVSIDKLVPGDIVTITVEDGVVTEIWAIGRSTKRKDEGTIKKITLDNPITITIVSEDDEKEYTYEISKTVDVEIDDDDAEIYDLRPNNYVKLTIENKVVTKIDAEKNDDKDVMYASVVKVYKDIKRIKVKYTNPNTMVKETKYVEVPDDAKIISNSGTTIRLSQLYEDIDVFIEGYYDDDLFIAKKIVELE